MTAPVRFLYLDADRFFAQVELRARGLPPSTALVVTAADEPPVRDGHSIIAVSSAAKAMGVKRGMRVAEARGLCRGLRCVSQCPPRYVDAHRRMLQAVDTVLPVVRACSIDEVLCRLDGRDDPVRLMRAVKDAVRAALGPVVTVSLGVSATPLLAKVAAESRKPDGATWWPRAALPWPLLELDPDVIPGIGPSRRRMLQAVGMGSMAALWSAGPKRWKTVLGTVDAERLCWAFHGIDVPFPRGPKRTLSCARVLVPGERDRRSVYGIARALVLTVMQRAQDEHLVLRTLRIRIAGAVVGVDVEQPPSYLAVLRALARRWPVEAVAEAASTMPWGHDVGRSVGVDASVEAVRNDALVLPWDEVVPDPLSCLLDAVWARYGYRALCFGNVRRNRWMGRKLAFEQVPKR